MLKASEALMLGSTMLRPVRGIQNDNEGGGCALGMIAIVHGKKWYDELKNYYPWMSSGEKLPCACSTQSFVLGSGGQQQDIQHVESHIYSIVVHLFNQHVIDGSWTIEQLADWLHSVEPVETVEEKKETSEVVAVKA